MRKLVPHLVSKFQESEEHTTNSQVHSNSQEQLLLPHVNMWNQISTMFSEGPKSGFYRTCVTNAPLSVKNDKTWRYFQRVIGLTCSTQNPTIPRKSLTNSVGNWGWERWLHKCGTQKCCNHNHWDDYCISNIGTSK